VLQPSREEGEAFSVEDSTLATGSCNSRALQDANEALDALQRCGGRRIRSCGHGVTLESSASISYAPMFTSVIVKCAPSAFGDMRTAPSALVLRELSGASSAHAPWRRHQPKTGAKTRLSGVMTA